MKNNPFGPMTPEWQLFENMKSNDLLASSHAKDAERLTSLSAQARERAQLFREALLKIAPDFEQKDVVAKETVK